MTAPRSIRIADFTYVLPPERIAPHPLPQREASRLLVYREDTITDQHFHDLPELLPPAALLIMNDTRVVNARLHFTKGTGARIEVFCLEPDGGGPLEEAFRSTGEVRWRCTLGNAKRWKQGPLGQLCRSPLGDVQLFAERLPEQGEGELVRFTWAPESLTFAEVLHRAGEVPLPPYLDREAAVADSERYQTVYAKHEGSVAAPTAGLHFTPPILKALTMKGITPAHVTLHVGAGTFRPVHSETMEGHTMHQERIQVARAVVEQVRDAVGTRPLVVTGTTSLRTLESLYWHGARILGGADMIELNVTQWEPYSTAREDQPGAREALSAVLRWMDDLELEEVTGSTRLLIAPGYSVRLADALITNFHQPGSTLLLLVAAFVGPDWRRIYDHALANDYRFLSYGDSSLLFRGQ